MKGIEFYRKSLKVAFPELAAEWSDKNIFLPSDFTYGSHAKVWWACREGHEYYTRIDHRAIDGTGCPICAQVLRLGYHPSIRPRKAISA